ncbi:unnamed protein product [Pedinophyceae sp. YPF-701]|nr:unnamed protein product [Pedinophyceae sp. YPF-701]
MQSSRGRTVAAGGLIPLAPRRCRAISPKPTPTQIAAFSAPGEARNVTAPPRRAAFGPNVQRFAWARRAAWRGPNSVDPGDDSDPAVERGPWERGAYMRSLKRNARAAWDKVIAQTTACAAALRQLARKAFAFVVAALETLDSVPIVRITARVGAVVGLLCALANLAASRWGVRALNDQMPNITRTASTVLCRDVTVKSVQGVSVTGLSVQLEGLYVGPRTDAAPERSSLTVPHATVRIDPVQTALRGRVVLTAHVDNPHLELVQCQNFSWFGNPVDTEDGSAQDWVPGLPKEPPQLPATPVRDAQQQRRDAQRSGNGGAQAARGSADQRTQFRAGPPSDRGGPVASITLARGAAGNLVATVADADAPQRPGGESKGAADAGPSRGWFAGVFQRQSKNAEARTGQASEAAEGSGQEQAVVVPPAGDGAQGGSMSLSARAVMGSDAAAAGSGTQGRGVRMPRPVASRAQGMTAQVREGRPELVEGVSSRAWRASAASGEDEVRKVEEADAVEEAEPAAAAEGAVQEGGGVFESPPEEVPDDAAPGTDAVAQGGPGTAASTAEEPLPSAQEAPDVSDTPPAAVDSPPSPPSDDDASRDAIVTEVLRRTALGSAPDLASRGPGVAPQPSSHDTQHTDQDTSSAAPAPAGSTEQSDRPVPGPVKPLNRRERAQKVIRDLTEAVTRQEQKVRAIQEAATSMRQAKSRTAEGAGADAAQGAGTASEPAAAQLERKGAEDGKSSAAGDERTQGGAAGRAEAQRGEKEARGSSGITTGRSRLPAHHRAPAAPRAPAPAARTDEAAKGESAPGQVEIAMQRLGRSIAAAAVDLARHLPAPNVEFGGLTLTNGSIDVFAVDETLPRRYDAVNGRLFLGKGYRTLEVDVSATPGVRHPTQRKVTMPSATSKRHLRSTLPGYSEVPYDTGLEFEFDGSAPAPAPAPASSSAGAAPSAPTDAALQTLGSAPTVPPKVDAVVVQSPNDPAHALAVQPSLRVGRRQQELRSQVQAPPSHVSIKVRCSNILVPGRSADLTVTIGARNVDMPMLERSLEIPLDIDRGTISGTLTIRSCDEESWAFPLLFGRVQVRGADFHFWDAPDDIVACDMDLLFEGKRLYFHNARGCYGAIPVHVTGDMDLNPDYGQYRLSAESPGVELNALRCTLGVRPLPFPASGAARGIVHVTGPLEKPIFSGTVVAVVPTGDMLAHAPSSWAQDVMEATPGAVAAYDKIPFSRASAVFTVDTSTEMCHLHAFHAEPSDGGRISGSGRMWLAPEAEAHPSAVSMHLDASALDGDRLLPRYLPPGAGPLPPSMRIGAVNCQGSMEGSHLAPRITARVEAPEASARGDVELVRDRTRLRLQSPEAMLDATLHTKGAPHELAAAAATQEEAFWAGQPLIEAVDGELRLRNADLLPLLQGQAPGDRPQPVRMRLSGAVSLKGRVANKGAEADTPGSPLARWSVREAAPLPPRTVMPQGVSKAGPGIPNAVRPRQGRPAGASSSNSSNAAPAGNVVLPHEGPAGPRIVAGQRSVKPELEGALRLQGIRANQLPLVMSQEGHIHLSQDAVEVRTAGSSRGVAASEQLTLRLSTDDADAPARQARAPDAAPQLGGEFKLTQGPMRVNASVNPAGSHARLDVSGLPLDELELASLRGNLRELSVDLNFTERLGRGAIDVQNPKFSGVQGESVCGYVRWEDDLVRLERGWLQQARSRYNVQAEYMFPPHQRLPATISDMAAALQEAAPGAHGASAPLGPLGGAGAGRNTGRWRWQVSVPSAELHEILPAANLLSRATSHTPLGGYLDAKARFLDALTSAGVHSESLRQQLDGVVRSAWRGTRDAARAADPVRTAAIEAAKEADEAMGGSAGTDSGVPDSADVADSGADGAKGAAARRAAKTGAAASAPSGPRPALPGLQDLRGRWRGVIQAYGGGSSNAVAVDFDLGGEHMVWGEYSLGSAVVRGGWTDREGLQLDDLELRAGQSALKARGRLLGPRQDAEITVKELPASWLQPLFRAFGPGGPSAASADAGVSSSQAASIKKGVVGALPFVKSQERVTTPRGPVDGRIHLRGTLGGSTQRPTGKMVVHLADGVVGATALEKAQAVAEVTQDRRLTFTIELEPRDLPGRAHVRGSLPLGPPRAAGEPSAAAAAAEQSAGPAGDGRGDAPVPDPASLTPPDVLGDVAEAPLGPDDVAVDAAIKDSGLTLLSVFNPPLKWQNGSADIGLEVRGTMKDPAVSGLAIISRGAVSCPYTRYPISQLNAVIRADNSDLQVEMLDARVGKRGHFRATGALPLRAPASGQAAEAAQPQGPPPAPGQGPLRGGPGLLDVEARGLELKVRNTYTGSLDSRLRVQGSFFAPRVGGHVNLSRGTIYLVPQGGGPALVADSPSTSNPSAPQTASSSSAAEDRVHNTLRALMRGQDGAQPAPQPGPAAADVTLDNLRVKLGPELRATYPFVMTFGLQGQVDISGPASNPDALRPAGSILFDGGEVNLVATSLVLSRDHPNRVVFIPEQGLDPSVDVSFLSGGAANLRYTIQGRASRWQDGLVIAYGGPSAGAKATDAGRLDPEEAAAVFEEQLQSSLLLEDGQLALPHLASSTVSSLLPKIESQGRLGKARWRLVSAPSVSGLLSLDPAADPSKVLASLQVGAEVEVQFGRSLQAAVSRKMRANEMNTQLSLTYHVTGSLRMSLTSSSGSPTKVMLEYSGESNAGGRRYGNTFHI